MQMHGYVKEGTIGRADRRAKHDDLQGMKKEEMTSTASFIA